MNEPLAAALRRAEMKLQRQNDSVAATQAEIGALEKVLHDMKPGK